MSKRVANRLGLYKVGDRLDIYSGVETRNALLIFPASSKGNPIGNPEPFAPREFKNRKNLNAVAAQAKELMAAGLGLQLDIQSEFTLPNRYVFGELKPEEAKAWTGHLRARLNLESGFICCGQDLLGIKPGQYVIDVFTLLPSPAAVRCLRETGVQWKANQSLQKNLASYWKETRHAKNPWSERYQRDKLHLIFQFTEDESEHFDPPRLSTTGWGPSEIELDRCAVNSLYAQWNCRLPEECPEAIPTSSLIRLGEALDDGEFEDDEFEGEGFEEEGFEEGKFEDNEFGENEGSNELSGAPFEVSGTVTTYWQLNGGFKTAHRRTDSLALVSFRRSATAVPFADAMLALDHLIKILSDEFVNCRLMLCLEFPTPSTLAKIWYEDPEVCHIQGKGKTWEIGFAEALDDPDRDLFETLPVGTLIDARWTTLAKEEQGACRFAGKLSKSGWEVLETSPALEQRSFESALQMAIEGLRTGELSTGENEEQAFVTASLESRLGKAVLRKKLFSIAGPTYITSDTMATFELVRAIFVYRFLENAGPDSPWNALRGVFGEKHTPRKRKGTKKTSGKKKSAKKKSAKSSAKKSVKKKGAKKANIKKSLKKKSK